MTNKSFSVFLMVAVTLIVAWIIFVPTVPTERLALGFFALMFTANAIYFFLKKP